MAIKIHVLVFWIMTLCSDVVGYQCFGGSCYFTPKMEAAWPSKTLVFNHITTLHHNLEDHNMNSHHAVYDKCLNNS